MTHNHERKSHIQIIFLHCLAGGVQVFQWVLKVLGLGGEGRYARMLRGIVRDDGGVGTSHGFNPLNQ